MTIFTNSDYVKLRKLQYEHQSNRTGSVTRTLHSFVLHEADI